MDETPKRRAVLKGIGASALASSGLSGVAGAANAEKEITFCATGQADFHYYVKVSGELWRGGTHQSDKWDKVDHNSVDGACGEGRCDSFRFTGEIVSEKYSGPGEVRIDGKKKRPNGDDGDEDESVSGEISRFNCSNSVACANLSQARPYKITVTYTDGTTESGSRSNAGSCIGFDSDKTIKKAKLVDQKTGKTLDTRHSPCGPQLTGEIARFNCSQSTVCADLSQSRAYKITVTYTDGTTESGSRNNAGSCIGFDSSKTIKKATLVDQETGETLDTRQSSCEPPVTGEITRFNCSRSTVCADLSQSRAYKVEVRYAEGGLDSGTRNNAGSCLGFNSSKTIEAAWLYDQETGAQLDFKNSSC